MNGKLTLGENTADNGGIRLAFMAHDGSLSSQPQSPIDGFTPEQRFFLAFGQSLVPPTSGPKPRACAPKLTRIRPPKDRVNGVVQNMPEFQKAFSCRVGQPMVRSPACRVW